MADVKFKKQADKYYVTFNNSKLISAKVTVNISWDLDENGYSVPFECLSVTGKGDTTKKKCRSGDSGEKTLEFLINRNVRTDYELEFDTKVKAEVSSDKSNLKIFHPLISEKQAKKEINLLNQEGWGVVIPGNNAIIDDSQIELYMERVDDPDSYGTALDAVEIPSFNGNNRMSFKNQKKDSETEFFGIRSSYSTFYKFDLQGTQKDPKLNSGSGDWKDGETFPSGDRLEFFDGDGDDVNAYLHIKTKDITVNKTNLEGARLTLSVTEQTFEEDPTVILVIKGIKNKQLEENTNYTSDQPGVVGAVGQTTFSLVSNNTATGFTVNSETGIVQFTTPAYDDSGEDGANDYQFVLKVTDSKSPVAQTGTLTRVVSVLEPSTDPEPEPEDEPEPEIPDAGDTPPPGGGSCGIDPPVITLTNKGWGIKIPKRVLEGSEMNIRAAKRDNPEDYGTALKNFGIEGSDGTRHRKTLDPAKETDEKNITFKVQSSEKTFYKFKFLDNIKEPAYSTFNKRLEFRDNAGSDANAWIEIDDKKTKFNCDDIPGEPETDCPPGPWKVGGDVYYSDSIEEPIPPELEETGGGLRLSLSGDRKDVKINLRNYENQLVTLKLTWTTNANWDQAFILKNQYMSDLLIGGKTATDGGSRYGEDGNEYNIPNLELIKGGLENVTKTLYLYNVDGGDYDTIVSMSSTPGPEPERIVSESVGTEVEGAVAGISLRDEQGDLGDDYTAWGGSSSQEFKNNQGGSTPPNWGLGTREVTFFETFDMIGGSGEGLQISAKIYGREGEGGNLRNTTVQIQSIVNSGSGYVNGDFVTFPSPHDVANLIKITAIANRTDFSCVEQEEKETWTEAGGTWPRFPQEAAIAKNGGDKVEWYWEDGGGGPEWDDQKFVLEVVGKRNCVPWGDNNLISMDKQLQEFVWIPSSVIEDNPDGEEGHSLEDYHIHSDKIRFRRPLTHSSLTNLKISGTGMKEFRGVAGALQPQYYGL